MAEKHQETSSLSNFSERQLKMSRQSPGIKSGVILLYVVVVPLLIIGVFDWNGITFSWSRLVYLMASAAVVLVVYVRGVGSWWGFLSAQELEGKDPTLLEKPLIGKPPASPSAGDTAATPAVAGPADPQDSQA